MPEKMNQIVERLRSATSTVTVAAKVAIIAAIIVALVAVAAFARWVSAPTMAPLFTNLAASDASAIVEELNASSVPYELADGGQTVMVESDAVYDTRLSMSAKGLPEGETTGYALLDEQGITTSEFQQQVSYQRALEAELASTLGAIDGVKTSVVRLAIPKKDVFVSEEKEPSASVLLDMSTGSDLSASQIQAVTNLVASSVEGMTPKSVTVADSKGNLLSAAGEDFAGSSVTDTQTEAEQVYEGRLTTNAQDMLDRIVGPGKAVVKVRADLNFDKRQSKTKTYNNDPDVPPLSESRTNEEYTGAGPSVGGVLGLDAEATQDVNGNDSDYKKDTRIVDNAVGESVESVTNAPGSVNRLTVSVVVDEGSAGVGDEEEIQALVSNAVGFDADRGDAITVASMPLDTSTVEANAAALAEAEAEKRREQIEKYATSGAVAALILLVLLVAWLRRRRGAKFGRGVGGVEELEVHVIPEEIMAEMNRMRAELDKYADMGDVVNEAERERRQVVRDDISETATSNPDDFAALVRGWLVEDNA